MAAALVQSRTSYPATSLAFTGSCTAGNLIIVMFSGSSPDATVPTNSGAALTWTKIHSSMPPNRNAPGSPVYAYGYWAVVDSNRVITVTIPAIGDAGLTLAEFSGVDVATPVHAYVQHSAPAPTSAPTITGLITTITTLIVAYFADESENASSPAAGPGYTLLEHTDNHVDISEYITGAAAATHSPSITYGATATTWLGFAFALKESAPASTISVPLGMFSPELVT